MKNKTKVKPGSEPRKKNSVKRKRNITDNFLNSIQVPLSNKFNLLNDKDEDITECTPAPSKSKISPIIVTDHDTDIKKITTDLKIDCEFKIMSIGRKIFVNSLEEKNKICAALKEKSVNHFSHPDNTNKVFKAVLTGLPEVDTKEISDCILKTNSIKTSKITMFKTASINKLYLCEFPDSTVNMKVLNNINSVYYHIVKWQPYKPKRKGPTQCNRCLMFGHGIQSCFRYEACAKCSGAHLTSECTNISITTTSPKFKCFNCVSAKLEHAHRADDPACPFRAKYLATKTNARNKTNRGNIAQNRILNNSNVRFVPAPAPPPLSTSFAAVSAQATTHSNVRSQAPTPLNTFVPPTNISANSTSTNNNTELWSFAEVASILYNSIRELKQCKSKLDQLMVITNMLQNACN